MNKRVLCKEMVRLGDRLCLIWSNILLRHFLCTFADLRRPRSEPSSFYSNVSHGDAPLSKKHKPNPETLQTQPSKSCSAPLGLDEQAHKSKMCPSREGTVEKEQRDGEQSQTKLGSTCGGGSWGSRQAAGRRVPTVGLGKERLANRLRLREIASAGTISNLRTTQEDLENTGDLQVRHREGTLTRVDCRNCFFCCAIG